MTVLQWVITAWVCIPLLALAAIALLDVWRTHVSRDRARGFLAADRALDEWVQTWEDAYALPSRDHGWLA